MNNRASREGGQVDRIGNADIRDTVQGQKNDRCLRKGSPQGIRTQFGMQVACINDEKVMSIRSQGRRALGTGCMAEVQHTVTPANFFNKTFTYNLKAADDDQSTRKMRIMT